MWVENPVHDDTIECKINEETMEVWWADTFDEWTSNEAICAMTEDAIIAEAADKAREKDELDRLMQDPDFAG